MLVSGLDLFRGLTHSVPHLGEVNSSRAIRHILLWMKVYSIPWVQYRDRHKHPSTLESSDADERVQGDTPDARVTLPVELPVTGRPPQCHVMADATRSRCNCHRVRAGWGSWRSVGGRRTAAAASYQEDQGQHYDWRSPDAADACDFVPQPCRSQQRQRPNRRHGSHGEVNGRRDARGHGRGRPHLYSHCLGPAAGDLHR